MRCKKTETVQYAWRWNVPHCGLCAQCRMIFTQRLMHAALIEYAEHALPVQRAPAAGWRCHKSGMQV
jgi:hypothetical protein